jgi:hypothetical protein
MNDPEMRNPLPSQVTSKPKRNYLDIDPKVLNGHKLPSEKSLLGTMLKTEKEWADKDGVEFDAIRFLGLKHEH